MCLISIEEKILQELQEACTCTFGNHDCYACKSNMVITDHESGEVVCSNCGLVISDNIQERADDRASFATDATCDRRRHPGIPNLFTRRDLGFSTIIGRPKWSAKCRPHIGCGLCVIGW